MRIEMPDGTAIVILKHELGLVLATQAATPDGGKKPKPSGVLFAGDANKLYETLSLTLGVARSVD